MRRHGHTEKHYPWAAKSQEERRARIKIAQRAYDQSPKGKAAAVLKRHRRNAQEQVTLTVEDVLRIKTQFAFKCFKCKVSDQPTLDHHIPLASGGKLSHGNVVLLCRKCNGLKADLPPEQFYSEQELNDLRPILQNQNPPR